MGKRYKAADIWRAIALLVMMVYHAWVLAGSPLISNCLVSNIVRLGGELGVTLFFVLSGFGIYYSIRANCERNVSFHWKEYLWARFKRIYPNYFFAIILALGLTNAAVYLQFGRIKDILLHLVFLHNFFPESHGSIISVLWTMGVIVQFYLLAPLLYKPIQKNKAVALSLSIVFSIFAKYLIFHIILPNYEVPVIYYFIFSRQIYSALDNFVIGMFLAALVEKDRKAKNRKNIVEEILGFGILFLWCEWGNRNGVYSDNITGYVWHSGLAMCLAFILYFAITAQRTYSNRISKFLLWIAKYEYGIYIWHYLVMENILNRSNIYMDMVSNGLYCYLILLLLIPAIAIGFIISKAVDALTVEVLNNQH